MSSLKDLDTDAVQKKLSRAIALSVQLPKETEHARCSSLGLDAEFKNARKMAVGVFNKTVQTASFSNHNQKETGGMAEDPFENLTAFIDTMCDRIDDTLLDREAHGVPEEAHEGGRSTCVASAPAPFNASSASASASSSSRSFFQGGMMMKPQERWKHLTDNFSKRFVPRLTIKHHMKAALEPDMATAINARWGGGDGVRRREGPGSEGPLLGHPYDFEIRSLDWQKDPNLQAKGSLFRVLPPHRRKELKDTPLVFVDDPKTLEDMLEELRETERGGGVIGIDVEHHNFRSFRGFVCLIQISTRQKDFVIDPFPIFEELTALNDLTADPTILKILHGADSDVIWLQRDFGVYLVNVFDTHQAARQIGVPGGNSLKNLLAYFCDVKADKAYQRSDWRVRPLPPQMIDYARSDTHHLPFLFDVMKNMILLGAGSTLDLTELRANAMIGCGEIAANGKVNLLGVLERSRDICLFVHTEQLFDEKKAASALLNRHGVRLSGARSLWCLVCLLRWRDRVARSEDEGTAYVLPDLMVIKISEKTPVTETALSSLAPSVSKAVEARKSEIIAVVAESLEEVERLGMTAHEIEMMLSSSDGALPVRGEDGERGEGPPGWREDRKRPLSHQQVSPSPPDYPQSQIDGGGASGAAAAAASGRGGGMSVEGEDDDEEDDEEIKPVAPPGLKKQRVGGRIEDGDGGDGGMSDTEGLGNGDGDETMELPVSRPHLFARPAVRGDAAAADSLALHQDELEGGGRREWTAMSIEEEKERSGVLTAAQRQKKMEESAEAVRCAREEREGRRQSELSENGPRVLVGILKDTRLTKGLFGTG
uniref:HRDC domain-containing protein n=1 Tax=Chromera velia CCMP2878 TaxID=1169474 RepID=A0A0G4GB73_9ALVE|eukprot:Cvel_21122.t1-p1 / transcript=Cvel_21122.t1 / gene=Cvel_21122 / organism=Chromera_velia_CCMP2878 / gene_product=Exosome component 10, putative / transcript_product=Exosome component 10, putative / location=Cvel_scaffold1956:817-8795(-) / protein_length=823 / sequence_SO=supercontig / SO=protein_coding / is_pseudo=false